MLVQEMQGSDAVAELVIAMKPIAILRHAQSPLCFIERTLDFETTASWFRTTIGLQFLQVCFGLDQ